MTCVNIIVSDFDNTIFKRNYGLIEPVVKYLEGTKLPIYIITYRAENQFQFIMDTIGDSLNIIGIGFADSPKKEVDKKLNMMSRVLERHNVVEALDDELEVVQAYKRLGVNARQP